MFENTVFCLTGTMSVPRKVIESNIKGYGGSVASSVTGKVTHLVATSSEAGTSKYKKAEANGIPIVVEGYLDACKNAGSLLDPTPYLVGSGSGTSGGSALLKNKKKKASNPAPAAPVTKKAKKASAKSSPAPAPTAVSFTSKAAAVDKVASSLLPGASVLGEFSCTLNQTNLGDANNNKFYICQALQSAGTYYEFSRWGRVGASGQHKSEAFASQDAAIKAFEKKFKSKTGNNWADRENFEKKKGKYELIETEQDSTAAATQVKMSAAAVKAQAAAAAKAAKIPSKLDKATQDLVSWILDADMFKSAMQTFKIDTNKCPLGAITKNQVAKGFDVLTKIDQLLNTGKIEGKGKKLTVAQKRNEIAELSGRFYTVIPHATGMARPPLIDEEEILKSKFDLVAMLGDIEIAQGLQAGDSDEMSNPIDQKYAQLQARLEHVGKTSKVYKMVQKYIDATKSGYNNIKMLDMWEVDRNGEGDRFKAHKKLGNRRLLWHGTNVAVVAAILKTGLRIMPTASSGSRVGRGIYLASENGKSSGYCRTARVGNKNHAIMFLCEAAMGKSKEIQRDDWTLTEAPKGYDSIVAVGNQEPDPSKDAFIKIEGNDVLIPQGKPIPTGKSSSFHQSEYLVYKESQCRIRYILRCEF